MKKYLLFIAFSFVFSMSFAQTYSFCKISESSFFGSQTRISLDFGQYSKNAITQSDKLVIGENGEVREFNSIIDALNFLVSKGWEFVQVYSVDDNEAQFLLKWDTSKGEPFIPKLKGEK